MFDILWGRGKNLQSTREATFYLFNTLKYLGINPPPTTKWTPIYYLYSVIMNIIVLVLTSISFIFGYVLLYNQMTTEQLLTSLQAALNVYAVCPKVLTLAVSLKHLRRAETIMNTLDGRCELEVEFKKIRQCVIIGNRLTMFYICLYVLYCFITFLSSVAIKQPPYSFYIPFMDWRNLGLELALQSLIEFIIITVGCFHQATVDSYAVIYIYVLRTHMQILVERVRRLGGDLNKSNDEYYEQLVLCIKDHQNLLSLVNIISPVISITIFVQFTFTAIILCVTLINILIFADTSAQIASAIYFLAVSMQTVPCCYQATCLVDNSSELALAIFHCNWFEKDKRFRKMLIFFMLRSQTPITLTALKLFPITLDTSLSIVKFSFSLYTLIKQMDFGQKLN